jgi:hypothetical protein
VVISGRKIPRASYKGGIDFFKNISTNCTKVAITIINTMVCEKISPDGSRMYFCIGQVIAVAITETNTTAVPIPMDTSTDFEVPKKGQFPRYWAKTILFIKMAAIISMK